jgi:hypothetical protein
MQNWMDVKCHKSKLQNQGMYFTLSHARNATCNMLDKCPDDLEGSMNSDPASKLKDPSSAEHFNLSGQHQ